MLTVYSFTASPIFECHGSDALPVAVHSGTGGRGCLWRSLYGHSGGTGSTTGYSPWADGYRLSKFVLVCRRPSKRASAASAKNLIFIISVNQLYSHCCFFTTFQDSIVPLVSSASGQLHGSVIVQITALPVLGPFSRRTEHHNHCPSQTQFLSSLMPLEAGWLRLFTDLDSFHLDIGRISFVRD